jgi:hypothetical protein
MGLPSPIPKVMYFRVSWPVHEMSTREKARPRRHPLTISSLEQF